MYLYQENNGEYEIILETEDGFSWVCDCGLVAHPKSKENAEMIVNALNGINNNFENIKSDSERQWGWNDDIQVMNELTDMEE